MQPLTPVWNGVTAEDESHVFYRRALKALTDAHVPFLLGGAYALAFYTGITRDTKDIDVFVRRLDLDGALGALERQGYRTERTYPHWLAKAFSDHFFVDVIFRHSNGTAPVDDDWFKRAVAGQTLGERVKIIAPEHAIWSKIFTMDRGRFDGADVAHMIRACGRRLDWQLLLDLVGRHWPVLFSHLTLFGYIYPSDRDAIPGWVMQKLISLMQAEAMTDQPAAQICRGTLFSPTQYLPDVQQWGYQDARLPPWGTLTPEEIEQWTAGVQAGK